MAFNGKPRLQKQDLLKINLVENSQGLYKLVHYNTMGCWSILGLLYLLVSPNKSQFVIYELILLLIQFSFLFS